MIVLGLHGGVTIGQHEPGAALIVDGRIVAACEEERYLRIKSAYGYLPYHSIRACLQMAGIRWEDIDLVVTPGSTYDDFEARIRDYLRHSFGSCPRLERVHHQMAHLATAFYGPGLEESLLLSLDATGDGACSMTAHATREGGIRVIEELPTSRSLGFFYTLMTYYLGFADGDEYKVMGLAPYGSPSIDLGEIIRPLPGGWDFDWSFVRSDPFPRSPFEPSYAAKIASVLGQPNRTPGGPMSQFYKDVARSTQAVFEECLLSLVRGLKDSVPGSRNLCFAGGTALNCSGNRRLLYSGEFDNIYVPPVASDRGLPIGCAYLGAVMLGDKPWRLATPYLGSSYSNDASRGELTANGIPFKEADDPAAAGAQLLAEGRIVGWYQGRSEAGARALGNRSIIARCDSAAMRDTVNTRIKYREEFRPFAPSLLSEAAGACFDTRGQDTPYMCFTLDVDHTVKDKLAAVVHVDDTARVQTVRSSDNEIYYDLIARYRDSTGTPAIMNTSFNLKGQPIVETPRDAIMTFFGCGLDALVLGNFIVRKPA
jgi:carbamoyltransferase